MGTKRKLALIGAGAIGSYIIWGMDKAEDTELVCIADGVRAERLRTQGLYINGEHYFPTVVSAQEAGVQDVVMITVKYHALAEALKDLLPLIDAHTAVISFLNGVDSEELVAEVIGRERVVHTVFWVSVRRTGNEITFNDKLLNGILFGRGFAECGEAQLELVREMFARSRMRYTESEDIRAVQWLKFGGNIANNLPQAMVGAPEILLEKSEHGLYFADGLWREVRAVAKAQGVELSEETELYTAMPSAARFSTLQDLDAGRHTEIDMFAGVMIQKAKEAGIPVPFCEMAYHLIKALEEKNDGLFDC